LDESPLRYGEGLLRLQGVTIGRGRRALLTGISLEVGRGETLAVVGPNGAGKSTLLATLLGTLPPLAGQVWRRPGLTVGYVPQRSLPDPLFPLDALDVVATGGLGERGPGRWRGLRLAGAARARACLDQLELGGLARVPFRDLSGGQQQRVLLARALVREPDLLVLDEPTSGMDLPSERDLLDLVVRLSRERHLALIFVTHDLGLAARYAERIALVNKDLGLFASDRTESLLTSPRLSALYGRPMEVHEVGGHLDVRAGERAEVTP
jgi:ABC-type Mn2+/Zn2+ transport system ATPase subunit